MNLDWDLLIIPTLKLPLKRVPLLLQLHALEHGD